MGIAIMGERGRFAPKEVLLVWALTSKGSKVNGGMARTVVGGICFRCDGFELESLVYDSDA